MGNKENAGDVAMIGEVLAHELPLIAFTTFSPAAVGVALTSAIYFAVAYAAGTCASAVEAVLSITALALVTVGMIASVLHLAKPHRAPFSLLHWRTSWLSREIIAVSAFWAVAAVWVLFAMLALAQLLPVWAAVMLNVLALVAGCALIAVIAKAYMVQGQPAWRGRETMLELAACAARVGVPLGVSAVLLWGAVEGNACAAFTTAGCVMALAASVVAYATERRAVALRFERLQNEEPTTRVLACVRKESEWSGARNRFGFAALMVGLAFSVVAFFADNLAAAVVCAVMAVAVTVLQMGLRTCFYGLFTTARTVPRFPGIS